MIESISDWGVIIKTVLPEYHPVTHKDFCGAWERIQKNTSEEKLSKKLRLLQHKLEDRHFDKVPVSVSCFIGIYRRVCLVGRLSNRTILPKVDLSRQFNFNVK